MPATQIGGCGCWTGLGRNSYPPTDHHSPSYDGSSSVQSVLKISMYSSPSDPRRSYVGAPRTSISSWSHPTPTATMSRPSDRQSRVASILALRIGWRSGMTRQLMPKRSVDVAVAMPASTVRLSHMATPPLSSHLPSR